MILVAIRMPEECAECPMSSWIRGGRFDGMLYCQAMESNDGTWTERCLVSEWEEGRPQGCPVLGEIKSDNVVAFEGRNGR